MGVANTGGLVNEIAQGGAEQTCPTNRGITMTFVVCVKGTESLIEFEVFGSLYRATNELEAWSSSELHFKGVYVKVRKSIIACILSFPLVSKSLNLHT
jgi:hypothetical protein